MLKLPKKGQFGSLQNAAIGLGVFFIIVALIATLLGEFQGTQTTNSLEYNITGQGLEDIDTLSGFGTIVVIVVVMVIILGLLFLFQRKRE